jgi:hypothetical protein
LNFSGCANPGLDSLTAFVAKLGPTLACSWLVTPETTGGTYSKGTAVVSTASGAVYAVGEFDQNATIGGCPQLVSSGTYDRGYVAKLTSAGACTWAKQFGVGGNDTRGLTVATDAEGNVVFGGGTGGEIDFGDGETNVPNRWSAFVAKLDPSGAHVWSHLIGDLSNANENVTGVAVDRSNASPGSVVVVGDFPLDVDTGLATPLTGAGNGDVFVGKFAP